VKQSTSDIKSIKTDEVHKILTPSKQFHELTLSKHTIHGFETINLHLHVLLWRHVLAN
jgi:hypothetical protein